mgnify:CR=1 FL=1
MKIINAYILYARTDISAKHVLQSEGVMPSLIGIALSLPEIMFCRLFKQARL